MEDPPHQRPDVGHIRHHHRGTGFPCVPEDPDGAEGLAEGVIFAEDGADHDEDAEGKESGEGDFLGKGRAEERRRSGRGMERMRISEERLKVKFVMRWWVAVVHCAIENSRKTRLV